MSDFKIKLYHEEMMQEEGLKLSDLPKEIQNAIKGFNILKSNFENSENPTQKDFNLLQTKATKIGDMIQNFVEQEYDDEDEDDEDEEMKDKKSSSNAPKKETKKNDKDDEEDEDEDEKSAKEKKSKESSEPVKNKKQSTGKFGNSMMEKKILAIMEAKGEKRIRISDLEAIIGREPDYPEQVVNNIKLRKVFLSSDYRLV